MTVNMAVQVNGTGMWYEFKFQVINSETRNMPDSGLASMFNRVVLMSSSFGLFIPVYDSRFFEHKKVLNVVLYRMIPREIIRVESTTNDSILGS